MVPSAGLLNVPDANAANEDLVLIDESGEDCLLAAARFASVESPQAGRVGTGPLEGG